MSKKAKQEYLAENRKRYFTADKAGKKQMLDEFCSVCCSNRKYAIRLLGKKAAIAVRVKPPGRRYMFAGKDKKRRINFPTGNIC